MGIRFLIFVLSLYSTKVKDKRTMEREMVEMEKDEINSSPFTHSLSRT